MMEQVGSMMDVIIIIVDFTLGVTHESDKDLSLMVLGVRSVQKNPTLVFVSPELSISEKSATVNPLLWGVSICYGLVSGGRVAWHATRMALVEIMALVANIPHTFLALLLI